MHRIFRLFFDAVDFVEKVILRSEIVCHNSREPVALYPSVEKEMRERGGWGHGIQNLLSTC